MPLIDMRDLLLHARNHRYAVTSLRVGNLDFLEGVIDAAEDCRAPAVLSLAVPDFEYYDPELFMAAAIAACERSNAPLALQLDYATNPDTVSFAIRNGCNSVMVDGGHMELHKNMTLTKEIVRLAHACGVPVEGALGYVPGLNEVESHSDEAVYTTPGEAKGFIKHTGVDFLAVSIGTMHGHYRGRPKLNYARLRSICENVDVPLTVHGGTGLSDDQVHKLVSLGVTKISYFTALSKAAETVTRQAHNGSAVNRRSRAREARQAIRAETIRLIRVLGASGRAAEVLAQCREWKPVQCVMIYDDDGIPETKVKENLKRERAMLESTPGVRRVIQTQAMTTTSHFHHCLIVELAHAKVMDHWRLGQTRYANPTPLHTLNSHDPSNHFNQKCADS